MAIEIHPDCQKRLTEIIVAGLEELTIDDNMFLNVNSFFGGPFRKLDGVLPVSGKLRERLHAYVSETPVFDFIYQTMWRELIEERTFDSTAPTAKLSELEGYTEVGEIGSRLVSDFCSLPWQYSVTLPLPVEIGGVLNAVQGFTISKNIRLTVPDETFSREFSLTSGIEPRDRRITPSEGSNIVSSMNYFAGLAGLTPQVRLSPKWDMATSHLQIHVNGFIGAYGVTAPAQDAIDSVKSFLGIGLALRIFGLKNNVRSPSPISKLYVHRRVATGWIIERSLELDKSISDGLHNLVFHDLDGRLKTESKQIYRLNEMLPKLACAFSGSDQSNRLALAGQWLFDSYCGTNELLSFVQAAVVMEILLGDKAVSDLMGLGELLRNRCAYLISNTSEEREMVLRDFGDIYNVRSKIVHGGKKRLNRNEFELFQKLRWLCRRVISKEIELIQKGLDIAFTPPEERDDD